METLKRIAIRFSLFAMILSLTAIGCLKVTPSPLDTSQGGFSGWITLIASGDPTGGGTIVIPPITIHITVTGLSGTGLVLQNNGSDDLTVTDDGDYNFDVPINPGDSYNITVKEQPTDPPQQCRVENGTGVASASTPIEISVSCSDFITIGGTLTGLSGTGLVLQNNGGDDLSLSSNGSFAFDTQILDGETYNVTVLTQPVSPTQQCDVTNGSGIASFETIVQATVSCSTLTVTIGGSISGLNGTGLVLQNNGGDDLSILADGTFTFTSPIPEGGAYDVTILTPPGNPPQQCSITGGSGTASEDDVLDISISCVDSTWPAAQTVATLGVSATPLLDVGIDDSTNVHLTYIDRTGAGAPIAHVTDWVYTDGLWNQSLDFTITGASFDSLDLAVNSSGKAVVATNNVDSVSGWGLYAAVYDPSTGWPASSPELEHIYTANSCSPVFSVIWTSGKGLVACNDAPSYNYLAYSSFSGSTFASWANGSNDYTNNIEVGYSPQGYAAYAATYNSGNFTYLRNASDTGTLWTDVTDPADTLLTHYGSSIAVNANGDILLARTNDNSDIDVYTGTGTSLTALEMVGLSNTGSFDTVLDDQNNGFLFWTEDAIAMKWSYYQGGVVVLTDQTLQNSTSIMAGPVAAINSSGYGYVAWTDQLVDGIVTVYVATIDTVTGTVGSPQALSPTTLDVVTGIRIAVNERGQTVIGFSDYDGISVYSAKAAILE